MSEEFDVLRIVANNPSISQRMISKETGISLGQVNFLIKKCVKKGLIKIEGQTTKSIKYNLTPKGIAEKTALTLEYIKISYRAITAISSNIRVLVKRYHEEGKKIYLYGSDDEMMKLIKMTLNEEKIDFKVVKIEGNPDFDVDEKSIDADALGVLLYWGESPAEKIVQCKYINILE
ncbi:MAG TPA: winged helix-turn-helix transcriptional regulator [Patescibacteria group bacterium]|nr:winged helix-turn-helix transcriptional regulator [Patescibacteria group bacterium]